MQTIIIGLICLGFIVLIHELGHYLVAKHYKLTIEEFAIGIGPKLMSFHWINTMWSIRALPLGGFCKIKNPLPMSVTNTRTTIPKTVGTLTSLSFRGKALVLLGGPFANILLFMLLSLILYGSGGQKDELAAYIDPSVSPALESSLQTGDRIIQIQDIAIQSYSQIVAAVSKYIGETITIQYIRNNTSASTVLTLNAQAPALGVVPYIEPRIAYTEHASMAAALQLQEGDIITAVNNKKISNAIYIPSILQQADSTLPVIFEIQRNGSSMQVEGFIKSSNDYFTDIGIAYTTVSTSSWSTFGEFVRTRSQEALTIAKGTLTFFLNLLQFKTKAISQQAVGPVRLISIVGSSTLNSAQTHGWWIALMSFINITSLLSLGIAAANLLPIPVLDGGQLLFYGIHRISNKQPAIRTQLIYNSIGGIFLLCLFAFIVFSDIVALL